MYEQLLILNIKLSFLTDKVLSRHGIGSLCRDRSFVHLCRLRTHFHLFNAKIILSYPVISHSLKLEVVPGQFIFAPEEGFRNGLGRPFF